nr:hypothetical protein CFP56_53194 [Quercus suber]
MGIGCGECNPYQRLSAFSGNATTIVFRFEPFCPAEPQETTYLAPTLSLTVSRSLSIYLSQSTTLHCIAKAIIEKFMTECTPKHVEHRFKTLKTNWNTIALLRNKKSKFGWKIITYDRTVYDEEVEAHPNHAKFLNKKIEIFDEMALVLGKDMATGGFSKGVGDIGVEALDDSPPLVDANVDDVSKKKQVDPSHVASNETWSHRKRSHATMIEDAVYQDLSIQLGKVASAIEKISENQLNFGSLYEEVMKMDGSFSSILDPFLQSDIPASQNDAARANPSPTMLKNSVELPEQHPSTPVLEQHPLPSPSSPVSPSSSTSAEPPCSPP